MTGQRLGWVALVVTAGALAMVPARPADGGEMKSTVRVGLTGSLFRDLPDAVVPALMRPFKTLVEAQTGLSGELVPGIKPQELGQRLKDDKLQLAVYQGFEYAWARECDPALKPLMIAVNHHKYLHGCVVVREGGPAKLADLKGKTIAVARRTREHCHLFLDHQCAAAGTNRKDFFSKILTPLTPEEAVDSVVNGHADAALADGCFLDWYQKHKPDRFARLKVADKSAPFPATVVVYYANSLDDALLRRFREGLLAAKDNPRGVQLMTLCQMTSFEPIPDDYDKALKAIAKEYPKPKDDK